MYDGARIFAVTGLFLGTLFTPFWYNATTGQVAAKPNLVKPTESQQSIESTEYMRANHMQMLVQWRDDVVRNGDRTYVATDGEIYEKSLTATCFSSKCHATNKVEFCDRCHDYSNVKPSCWNCHTAPTESKG